jgi:hypothetical protein
MNTFIGDQLDLGRKTKARYSLSPVPLAHYLINVQIDNFYHLTRSLNNKEAYFRSKNGSVATVNRRAVKPV